jgi:general secretion pathway protein G
MSLLRGVITATTNNQQTNNKESTTTMLAHLKKKRSEEGGFTLIELLIVVIILGILAAIVVFAVGTTRKDSVAATCKTNVKAIQLSGEAVKTKSGAYPAIDTTQVGTPATAAPLRFANVLSAANNGALLKTYPTSGDYTLEYVPATNDVNVFAAGTNYINGAMTNATAGYKGTNETGCDALP